MFLEIYFNILKCCLFEMSYLFDFVCNLAYGFIMQKLVAISGCGHLPHEECPKALLAAILPFISNLLTKSEVHNQWIFCLTLHRVLILYCGFFLFLFLLFFNVCIHLKGKRPISTSSLGYFWCVSLEAYPYPNTKGFLTCTFFFSLCFGFFLLVFNCRVNQVV